MIYSSAHVITAAEIDSATLRNWTVRGVIEPSQPAQGRGRPARFSEADLMTVAALARLTGMGMGLGEAAPLAERIGEDAATYLFLIRNPSRPTAAERPWRLYWTHSPEGWRWASEPDPAFPHITIDAAAMAEEVMERLTNEHPEMRFNR